MRSVLAVAAAAAVTASVGCGRSDPPPPAAKLAPPASAVSPSPAPAKATRFVIDAKSTTSIDMPAPKEHIRATTDAAEGTLDVDPANLAASRGEVKIDLATLTTKTFDEEYKNAIQTGDARCWLEVTDCAEGKLDEALKRTNRFAVYAIRSVESPSATDLTKVEVKKDGGDDVRTVTLTARGDLFIHGHKAENRDADLEVELRYAPGAPAEKPRAVRIKTRTPLHVILAEHDVKPRDTFGKIAKRAFHLLGTKVADTADISLDLRAAPQS